MLLLGALTTHAAGDYVSVPPPSLRYEAESANLLGQTRAMHELPGGLGRSWVTGFTRPADAVEFTVTSPEARDYQLGLTYSAESAKQIPVYLNDNLLGSRLLPATTGFETRPYGRIPLAPGVNRLRIGTDWGYADLDSIYLTPAAPPAEFQLRDTPVNPASSPEARRLHTRLLAEFGRRTFAAQHESEPAHPTRLAHIASLTDGKAPAILGLDLLRYSPAYAHPEGDGAIELALDWSLRRGGIVTLSWHWMSPFGAAEPVWRGFYTDKTTFDVSRVLDPASAEHRAILRDLDQIAVQLARLRDARVPVLWRPLHEAEGRWFWWGAHGPEAVKALYKLMFDRFTKVHGLDNLLWVWTTTDNDDALDWYPGDEYVDILAADLYAPASGGGGDFFTVFDRIRAMHGGRKPIALGECDALPPPTSPASWLWALVWDDFITRTSINPLDRVMQFYATSNIITLASFSASP